MVADSNHSRGDPETPQEKQLVVDITMPRKEAQVLTPKTRDSITLPAKGLYRCE